MKTNYQLLLDRTLQEIAAGGEKPSLLLHSCCGPCSTYVLEYLTKYFEVTVYYYNPNIYPQAEYEKRLGEQKRVIAEMKFENPVSLLPAEYEPELFYNAAKGLEDAPEGGGRCEKCFLLRLEDTAEKAAALGFRYFTTTLSVSPHKNSALLNEIGRSLGEKHGVSYLFADFKKREGYKRSLVLSAELDLYRQNYCGCEFSLRESK